MSDASTIHDASSNDEFENIASQREPWSAAAIRLLQGVVYHDDPGGMWDSVLAGRSPLTDYFARLGLLLIVDEPDGMAYLRQPTTTEQASDRESLPRLFRNVRFGFDATLLCVLLRDELRRSEEEDLQNDRCVVSQGDLLATWQSFSPAGTDDVRLNRTLLKALRTLEELKFVKQFEKEPPSWEVRRVLRARMPLSLLQSLRQALATEVARRASATTNDDEEVSQ